MEPQYSPQMKSVLFYSREEAMRLGNEKLETDHLFLGLLREGNNIAFEKLLELGIDLMELRSDIEIELKKNKALEFENQEDISLDTGATRVLKLVWLEAKDFSSAMINTEHLLLAILRDESSRIAKALKQKGINYETIKNKLSKDPKNKSSNPFDNDDDDDDDDAELEKVGVGNPTGHTPLKGNTSTPVLDNFGFDLTKAAEDNALDPVVGRETEIERLAQILSRRKKNNPVLIGEPGVGKSAIVEGMAIKIVKRQVSRALFNKRIMTLDLASMVAGTKYRGQFEERIKMLMNELLKNPHIILFIDELHTLVGAGGASGSLDAANILKPALARGEIQCIGATSLNEYRQYIEKDGALERRFQKIIVDPPTPEETIQILQKLKPRYEDHHNVSFTDKAIEDCVKLSTRYISDRYHPDKAIDVMDEAGSRKHIFSVHVPEKIVTMEEDLERTKSLKIKSVAEQDFEKAAKYRDRERDLIEALEKVKKDWDKEMVHNREVVNQEDVAHIIAMMTGVPVRRIAQAESQRLLGMADELKKRIIGQSEAIQKITKAVQRNRSGLKNPNRPIGTFIFLGPTGVGKTQLAKVLAEYLFDTTDALVRLDMSEYMEKFTVSRLVGAPPGYVGYEEGGQLTEKVRRKPYCVILLDEIEKAHQDVYHILLQLLDEGQLTDSLGRKINFKNTLIIMTSNIGSRQVKEFGAGIGFMTSAREKSLNDHAKSVIEKALKRQFTPEFINRIDEVVIFNKLSKEDISKIIDIELQDIMNRMKEMGYSLVLSDAAKNFIIEKGFDPDFGARPLKRALQTYLEDEMSETILSAQMQQGDIFSIDYNPDVSKEKVSVTICKPKESEQLLLQNN